MVPYLTQPTNRQPGVGLTKHKDPVNERRRKITTSKYFHIHNPSGTRPAIIMTSATSKPAASDSTADSPPSPPPCTPGPARYD